MLKRALLTEKISNLLVFLQSKIAIMNHQGLYNDNNYAQDIICRLYNSIFDYHLINLNRNKTTVEGIDLADKENRVAVQVTSEKGRGKIKHTIELFIKNELYKDYDRLLIAMLNDKRDYREEFATNSLFDFNKNTDIIDLKDLALHIKNCSLEKQQQVLSILQEELWGETEAVASEDKVSLEAMEQQVIARCRSKLISIGIERELTTTIIENDINSNRYSDILEAEEQGSQYLQGEFGSGKSHALCILFLRMLRDFRADQSKPLPLYATAAEIIKVGDVQTWVQKHETAETNFIFIDGCDEMSFDEANKVIEEVDYLRSLWRDTHFMLCGRYLHVHSLAGHTYSIPCLSESRVIELISMVSGIDQMTISRHINNVENEIHETLRRPFFTILYANLLKQKGDYIGITYSSLIEQFVDRALIKCGSGRDDIIITLEHISILAVDRNIGKVHLSEVEDKNVYQTLKQTGFLVLHPDNTVSFPLPIFAQWFAAEGILHRYISLDDILDDEVRASRWRYAFSLMFNKMTFDESLEFFAKIVKKDTGAVAEIIKNGTTNEWMEVLPSPLECGKMIYKCMMAWVDALGELREIITPIRNGRLMKLAINVNGCHITTTWADILDTDDVCVFSFQEQMLCGSVVVTRAVNAQATWPWIYVFDSIQDQLKKAIKNKTILCDNDDIVKEYVWEASLALLGKGKLSQDSIPLDKIEGYRARKNQTLIIHEKKYSLNDLFSHIDRLHSLGIHEIQPVVPVGDKDHGGGGFVWSVYSEQRMHERVVAVYEKALQAYSDYASSVFFPFVRRMRMAALMPGIFHGNLKYKEDSEDLSSMPLLSWHMEALPLTMKNSVDITLNEAENWSTNHDKIDYILRKDIANRPTKHEWLYGSFCSQVLDCFGATPVTDVVYKWIESDLKDIDWI